MQTGRTRSSTTGQLTENLGQHPVNLQADEHGPDRVAEAAHGGRPHQPQHRSGHAITAHRPHFVGIEYDYPDRTRLAASVSKLIEHDNFQTLILPRVVRRDFRCRLAGWRPDAERSENRTLLTGWIRVGESSVMANPSTEDSRFVRWIITYERTHPELITREVVREKIQRLAKLEDEGRPCAHNHGGKIVAG